MRKRTGEFLGRFCLSAYGKQMFMKSMKSKLKTALKVFAILLFIMVFVDKYIGEGSMVNGRSMQNTLHQGDILLQEKVSYQFKEPERYDVVVLKHHAISSEDQDGLWVKRVIGLPGETLQILDGEVYVNGKKMQDDIYGNVKIEMAGIASEPITIPEDEYFVMGDNRMGMESWDSRYEEISTIKREDIKAKVLVTIYPFERVALW